MKRWNVNLIEDWLLQAFLVGAVATSIILSIIGIDEKWYIPAIFAVLYIIYRQISDVSNRTAAGVESTFYGSNSEFYSSAQRRMQSATTHIWVTYVRLIPPPGFESPEADSYFRYGIEWARKNPDREFRRIVGAGNGGSLSAWLVQHYEDVKSIKNYSVRVTPFSGPVDGINFSIIDNSVVFLALSGEGNRLTGHSFDTPDAVTAFREYYLQWWDRSEKLEDYVSRIRKVSALSLHGREPSATAVSSCCATLICNVECVLRRWRPSGTPAIVCTITWSNPSYISRRSGAKILRSPREKCVEGNGECCSSAYINA